MRAKTVNRVYLLLAREEISSLEEIHKMAREVDYSFIEKDQTFAVRAERSNKKFPSTSPEIAAAVGSAVVDSYMGSNGSRLRVDLRNPDVEIYVLVRKWEALLSINLVGRSLHCRYYRVRAHRAALPPSLGAIMIRASGWRGEPLLDPMCGCETIPIESALLIRNIAPGARRELAMNKLSMFRDFLDGVRFEVIGEENRRKAEIAGMDLSPKSLEMFRKNLRASGMEDTVRVFLGDALRLHRISIEGRARRDQSPFGIRMGVSKIDQFYRTLAESLSMSGVRKITLITPRKNLIVETLSRAGYPVDSVLQFMYGG